MSDFIRENLMGWVVSGVMSAPSKSDSGENLMAIILQNNMEIKYLFIEDNVSDPQAPAFLKLYDDSLSTLITHNQEQTASEMFEQTVRDYLVGKRLTDCTTNIPADESKQGFSTLVFAGAGRKIYVMPKKSVDSDNPADMLITDSNQSLIEPIASLSDSGDPEPQAFSAS